MRIFSTGARPARPSAGASASLDEGIGSSATEDETMRCLMRKPNRFASLRALSRILAPGVAAAALFAAPAGAQFAPVEYPVTFFPPYALTAGPGGTVWFSGMPQSWGVAR